MQRAAFERIWFNAVSVWLAKICQRSNWTWTWTILFCAEDFSTEFIAFLLIMHTHAESGTTKQTCWFSLRGIWLIYLKFLLQNSVSKAIIPFSTPSPKSGRALVLYVASRTELNSIAPTESLINHTMYDFMWIQGLVRWEYKVVSYVSRVIICFRSAAASYNYSTTCVKGLRAGQEQKWD